MARTKGAVSNVSVDFSYLKELLGETYNGKVVVSIQWLKSVTGAGFSLVAPPKDDTEIVQPKKSAEKRPKFKIE